MLTCSKCRRNNPPQAIYCYFDGTPLQHRAGQDGPRRVAVNRFPGDFVFPSGRRCRSFDELAVALVEERSAAVDLLTKGLIESFFQGMGRPDLAQAARQSAQFPDPVRGLDMLLDSLPSKVLDPARLRVEPLNVHLGQLSPRRDHRFHLHLSNLGVRLLYGTASVENTPWLALGEPPGVNEKSFDCEHELDLPVLVRGDKLKAHPDTLQGRIVIESNGGTAEVVVRVDVPVIPFPHGVLAGARSQRQLAERAYLKPQEAAPLFESGAVARWYAENGWTYPVPGPTATGLGAIQQFFEACGLAQAPRVELQTPELRLEGPPGAELTAFVELRASGRRPIFAFASSQEKWIVPQQAKLSGTKASIPILVRVPDLPPGAPVLGQVKVVANGKQRFRVPVILNILPARRGVASRPAAPARRSPPEPASVSSASDTAPVAGYAELPRTGRSNFLGGAAVLPAAVLILLLFVLVLVDLLRPRTPAAPPPAVQGDAVPVQDLADVKVLTSDQGAHRFGIVVRGEKNGAEKQLTFDRFGRTNNTVVRINGKDYIYGLSGRPSSRQRNLRRPDEIVPGVQWRTIWDLPEGIEAIQEIVLRRSELTERYSSCLIVYTLENKDTTSHTVGLRFMLDTLIGSNDGVPFTIPGLEGLCDTYHVFTNPKEIPDFIQALEQSDLQNPGTVAHVTLRVHEDERQLEPPSRVQLSAWPNQALGMAGALGSMTRWDVPLASIRELPDRPDSAVILYWDPKVLEPKEKRTVAFAYGLGRIASTGRSAGRLALTVDGIFRPGAEFTVTAYVAEPQPGQTARLVLPDGLRLSPGQKQTQPVARAVIGTYSPVSWRVRAERTGRYTVTVESAGLSQSETVVIRTKSFLD